MPLPLLRSPQAPSEHQLIQAVDEQNLVAVQTLLAQGVEPNLFSSRRYTSALSLALVRERLPDGMPGPIVEALLAHGAWPLAQAEDNPIRTQFNTLRDVLLTEPSAEAVVHWLSRFPALWDLTPIVHAYHGTLIPRRLEALMWVGGPSHAAILPDVVAQVPELLTGLDRDGLTWCLLGGAKGHLSVPFVDVVWQHAGPWDGARQEAVMQSLVTRTPQGPQAEAFGRWMTHLLALPPEALTPEGPWVPRWSWRQPHPLTAVEAEQLVPQSAPGLPPTLPQALPLYQWLMLHNTTAGFQALLDHPNGPVPGPEMPPEEAIDRWAELLHAAVALRAPRPLAAIWKRMSPTERRQAVPKAGLWHAFAEGVFIRPTAAGTAKEAEQLYKKLCAMQAPLGPDHQGNTPGQVLMQALWAQVQSLGEGPTRVLEQVSPRLGAIASRWFGALVHAPEPWMNEAAPSNPALPDQVEQWSRKHDRGVLWALVGPYVAHWRLAAELEAANAPVAARRKMRL